MANTDKIKEDNMQASSEATSKIDAIKQLIFGENMQAYDSEFETLKKDILTKKKELEVLMDEVKSELLQNIDNLSTDINIRITELENNLEDKVDDLNEKKVDRKLLGELFTKLGEKISQ